MTIDWKALAADRDAGTQGPWISEHGEGPENPYAIANTGVWSEDAFFRALDHTDIKDEAKDDSWVCGIWGDPSDNKFTDARRIARVPDLEAYALEARAKLEETRGWADDLAEVLMAVNAQHGGRNAARLLKNYRDWCAAQKGSDE